MEAAQARQTGVMRSSETPQDAAVSPELGATLARGEGPKDARRIRSLEIIAVLGVSLGMSALYAVLYLVRADLTVKGGIAQTTATVVSGPNTKLPWLDLADNLADALRGVFPALLALVLLSRDPGLRRVGLLPRRGLGDVGLGVGFFVLIGAPGLALVALSRHYGINASLSVVDLPDVWYRIPYLLIDAAQNGLLEEVVVVAYLITRLRQLNCPTVGAIAASALLRGTYHLYQGYGAFVGNVVMGVIFGAWFSKTQRVVPLVIAHFLLDAVSFIGYLYLAPRVSWL
jgi:membrane protease YdiL (CAAX protease family)